MSGKGFVVGLMFALSEGLGLMLGEAGYRLFIKAMPAAAISHFNLGTTHGVYILGGAGAGLVIFLWSMLSAWLGRYLFSPSKPKPASPTK